MKVNMNEWKEMCAKLFTTVGVHREDALKVVDAAITADLRGVSSHGTVRLSDYRKRIEVGIINKKPNIKKDIDLPALIHVDGDNGLGHVVAMYAVEEGIKRAKEYGSCSVSIRNTNHMGMLSHYALKAAKKNVIAYIVSNTPPFVAAFGGAEPAIGTNPLCWAIPAREFPVVLDMAISPARGKIKNALMKGEDIPEGWALNKEGVPTTDAKEAMEGVLLPVGGPKGYGLGVVVEVLSGIISGSKYGGYMTHPLDDYNNAPDVGNFMIFIDVEKLIPLDIYFDRLDDYIKTIKAGKPSTGFNEIFIPGEIEYNKVKGVKDEIEVSQAVYDEIDGILKGLIQ